MLNHSESVFDKSSDREMSCDEYPVRMKQTIKKMCGEKVGGKVTTTTNNYN